MRYFGIVGKHWESELLLTALFQVIFKDMHPFAGGCDKICITRVRGKKLTGGNLIPDTLVLHNTWGKQMWANASVMTGENVCPA